MYKFLISVVVVLLFLQMIACSGDSDETPKVIQPLEVGNSWTYIDSFFNATDEYGNPLDSVSVDTLTSSIIGSFDFIYEDEEYTAYIESQEPYYYQWLRGNEKDGLYSYGRIADQDTMVYRCLHMKYPVFAGDEWIFQNIGDTTKIHFSCLSTNELYETPAGSFNCIVYTWDFHSGISILKQLNLYHKLEALIESRRFLGIKLYYVPDIGMVGVTLENNRTNELSFKRVLKSYNLENRIRSKYPTSW